MAGETSGIAEMAVKISNELFDWFKWDVIDLRDQNFECGKIEKHAKGKGKHSHPVDVVFHYTDPYLNKKIYLNTDLKSYKKGSITNYKMRGALVSLSQTIDCARSSDEWLSRYILANGDYEIRGLLFVYNHCGEFDKRFFEVFGASQSDEKKHSINISNINLEKDQTIHIVEPLLINYMQTIKNDINSLIASNTFPREKKKYSFFYPELHLHKTSNEKKDRAATIEMISSPILIIEHETMYDHDDDGKKEICSKNGYIIYYNMKGEEAIEFEYLFDMLSKYQILDGDHRLRIRVAHDSPHKNIKSFFERAKTNYSNAWRINTDEKSKLNRIEFELCSIVQKKFSEVEMGWRD